MISKITPFYCIQNEDLKVSLSIYYPKQNSGNYIAGWFSENGDHPAIFMPGYKKSVIEYPITGRKGDEIYALCCAGSGSESQAD